MPSIFFNHGDECELYYYSVSVDGNDTARTYASLLLTSARIIISPSSPVASPHAVLRSATKMNAQRGQKGCDNEL